MTPSYAKINLHLCLSYWRNNASVLFGEDKALALSLILFPHNGSYPTLRQLGWHVGD